MSTLKHGRAKFEPRAQPCVFWGYPMGKKAYKVYNMVTKRIYYIRDLVFHETYFPFQHVAMTKIVLPNHLFLSNTYETNNTSSVLVSSSTSTRDDHLLHSSPSPCSFSQTPELQQSVSLNHDSPPVAYSSTDILPRRTSRTLKPPSYLKDYICSYSHQTSTPHWCNLFSFLNYPLLSNKTLHNLTISMNQPHTKKLLIIHIGSRLCKLR